MPAPVVDARQVTKRFGEVVAVDGFGLRIEPGVVHGLLGPNGAGKTTVLAMLFGLLRPDAGAISIFGRDAGRSAPDLEGVAGFVEAPRFYPYLSGRRNLEVLAGLDGTRDDRVVDRVLTDVGLLDLADQGVKGYSLGMRQRLGMAASLMRSPRLLIVDEPANGLDPAGIRDLRSLLRRQAGAGVTVLLSSHNMPEVEAVCDQVTVMRAGRVVFTGSLEEMHRQAPHPSFGLRTSDDAAALALAAANPGVNAAPKDDGGLTVRATDAALDRFVVELGRSGVAVRRLSLDVTPMESLFFRLTEP